MSGKQNLRINRKPEPNQQQHSQTVEAEPDPHDFVFVESNKRSETSPLPACELYSQTFTSQESLEEQLTDIQVVDKEFNCPEGSKSLICEDILELHRIQHTTDVGSKISGSLSNRYFFVGFWLNKYFRFVPYTWNPQTTTLQLNTGIAGRLGWYFHILLNSIIILWSALRSVDAARNFDGSDLRASYYMLTSGSIAVHILHGVFQMNQFFILSEMPLFFQQYFSFCSRFEADFLYPRELVTGKEASYHHKVGVFVRYIWWGVLSNNISCLTWALLDTNIPTLPSSIMESPYLCQRYLTLVMVAQLVFSFYWFNSMYSNFFIYVAPFVHTTHKTCYVLQQLRLGEKCYTTKNTLRKPKEFVKVYRELQILHMMVNVIYCRAIVPASEWMCVTLVASFLCGSVRFQGFASIGMLIPGVVAFVLVVVAFSICAWVHSLSESMLQSWKPCSKGSPVFRRHLRSLQPLKIKVGSFYFCDKAMVLSLVSSISDLTVNLMVSTQYGILSL